MHFVADYFSGPVPLVSAIHLGLSLCVSVRELASEMIFDLDIRRSS